MVLDSSIQVQKMWSALKALISSLWDEVLLPARIGSELQKSTERQAGRHIWNDSHRPAHETLTGRRTKELQLNHVCSSLVIHPLQYKPNSDYSLHVLYTSKMLFKYVSQNLTTIIKKYFFAKLQCKYNEQWRLGLMFLYLVHLAWW